MRKKKEKTEFTIAEFAEKIGAGRATVWRWVTKDTKRLKMYDAEVVEVAGRKFISQTPKP